MLDRDFAAELIELCPDLTSAQTEVQSTRLPFLRRAVCIGDAPPAGAFKLWSDFLRGEAMAPAPLVEAMGSRRDSDRPPYPVLRRNPHGLLGRVLPSGALTMLSSRARAAAIERSQCTRGER